jgi:hypothetical protein
VSRHETGLAAWFLDRVDSTIERRKGAFLALYSVVFILVCGLLSATKPMANDELATYYPAKLPSLAATVAFFWDGTDVHTPTASVITRYSLALFGDNPVAARLPNILGYLAVCLSIFVFVARWCPVVYAASAMLFPVLCSVFYHATEVRCYGLLLGFTGLSFLCWQRVEDGRWRPFFIAGFYCGLAAAISCHYYALLLAVPFGLAELARTRMRRRLDLPVCAALILAVLTVCLFLHPILIARHAYLSGIWSTAHLGQIQETYAEVFTLTLPPILGAAILWMVLAPRLTDVPLQPWRRPKLPDRIFAGSLALLPVYAVLLSCISGAYVTRYALPVVAGLPIFLAFALCRALKASRRLGAAVMLVFVCWFLLKSVTSIRAQASENGGLQTRLGQPFQETAWMRALARSPLPVLTTPAVFFMELQHYAPESVRSRIVYGADVQLALKYDGISTGDTGLLLFARRLPLRVSPYTEFLARNPHFLLCAETRNPTWQLKALLNAGAGARLVARSDTHFVFDVTAAPSSGAVTAETP